MAAPETNWLPGILVTAAGVVGSLAYLFVAKRAAPANDAPPDDLNARYQTVIGELKEHTANKHLLPPEQWEAEKKRLEGLAVQLLKARDAHKHEALKAEARAEKRAQAAETGLLAKNPTLKGAFIGGAVVLFFAVLWFSMNSATRPREDGMGVTGMMPGGGGPEAPQEPQSDPKLEAVLGAVQKAPDDIDALAEAGLYLISKQGFDESRPFLQRATMLDPFHVKTRVGRAIMQAVDGEVGSALDELERLGTLYPDAYPGHLYAGMIAMDQNDPARAVKNFEQYVAVAPPGEVPPMMRGAIMQLRQQLAAGNAPQP
ncbi:MAG: hypothetical protein IAE78_08160 [Myxococcus sp.]|nr:hypothetical protein [Myxococcus sp.]